MYLGNCPNSRPEIASMRKTLVRGGSAKKNQACWYSIRRAGFMTLGVGLSHFPVHITTVMEGVLDPPVRIFFAVEVVLNTSCWGRRGRGVFPHYVLVRKRGWRPTEHGGGASGGREEGGLGARGPFGICCSAGWLLQLALSSAPGRYE